DAAGGPPRRRRTGPDRPREAAEPCAGRRRCSRCHPAGLRAGPVTRHRDRGGGRTPALRRGRRPHHPRGSAAPGAL
ncbi:MAG: hypothetical protein AVDCRST_MAG54-1124, partial [uncultured Actinomycetospora sp.]